MTSGIAQRRGRAGRCALLCAAALLTLATSARAQGRCEPAGDAAPSPPGLWSAPLDRTISLHARNLSLREALDRIAAAAQVRLSYSADLLPLDRRVCVSRDAIPAGRALAELLRETGVEPQVVGADLVVLAPVRVTATAAFDPAMAARVAVLDRVVVTGRATPVAQRSFTTAVDVIDSEQLARRAPRTMSQLLDGAVPGMWVWEQSPSNVLARYGSLRGASSFGASYPKMYIDGIEVAHPLLVTQLDPQTIERVEVIRGPQGAALYGADALGGVINIVTRHHVAVGEPRASIRTGAGMSESDFARRTTLAQDHALTLRAGSGARSGMFGLAIGGLGEFVPGAYSRLVSASGSARVIGARASLSTTARFLTQEAGAPVSPLLNGLGGRSSGEGSFAGDQSGADRQSMQQYTAGATATVMQGTRWTHSLTVGLDGYQLTGVPDDRGVLPSADDSLLLAARGGADRGTFRLSSVARFGEDGPTTAALTLAAEHSVLRESTSGAEMLATVRQSGSGRGPGGDGSGNSSNADDVEWWRTTGISAQTSAAFDELLYVTGGVRLERTDDFTGTARSALLPMVGASLVRDHGSVTVKLRAAYGKGIRAPRAPGAAGLENAGTARPRRLDLSPEEQSGVEGGVDVLVGRALSLQVTRFDQRASGLVQRVVTGRSEGHGHGRSSSYPLVEVLQNVGEIANRGWEMQARVGAGPLSVAGTLSFVDSRVLRVADDYHGDLRAGDRMLEVPARTASLTASWSSAGWSGSLTAARAADWINYDRLALTLDAATADPAADAFSGQRLRTYWREYGGITRLRATGTRELGRGLALLFTADNLLNRQRGEPDNLTVLPGRTITAGVRLDF